MDTNGNGRIKVSEKEAPSGEEAMQVVRGYAPRTAEKTVAMLERHGFFLSQTKNGKGVKCAACVSAIFEFSESSGYGSEGKLLGDALKVIADAGWKEDRTPFNAPFISAIAGVLVWIARSEKDQSAPKPLSAKRLGQVSDVLSPAGSLEEFSRLADEMGSGRDSSERRWDFLCRTCFKTPTRIVVPQKPTQEDATALAPFTVEELQDSPERFYSELMGRLGR